MHPTTITHLDFEPLDLPLTEPFTIATGAQHVAANVLVRVRLAEGSEGLGEAAPFPAVSGETQASTLEALEAVREAVVGQEARAWRRLSAQLGEALAEAPAARCGVEVALLDALARHHRVPLWSFFGGTGSELDTDMTVTAGDPAHAVSSARGIVARGISTLKVKVGALGPEEDAERLRLIHAEAPRARLLADANGGYSVEAALRFLKRLEQAGVPLELFEQPVPTEDREGLAALSRQGRVPVCADESARSARDVLELVRAGAVGAINIKAMKYGPVEALTLWSLARAAGLGLMVGAMVEGPLGVSFSTHLAAGLGGFSWVDLDTHLFVREHPFRGGLMQQGARLSVGHVQAGHGVELPAR